MRSLFSLSNFSDKNLSTLITLLQQITINVEHKVSSKSIGQLLLLLHDDILWKRNRI